jgi:multiple antibiotic resistance protein
MTVPSLIGNTSCEARGKFFDFAHEFEPQKRLYHASLKLPRMDIAPYLKAFLGLLAIVDPFIAVPLFLALTPNATNQDRKRIARIAATTVFVVLGIALLVGSSVLAFFGISLSAFKVAGAILLLISALSSFNATPGRVRQTPEEEAEAHDRHAIGVVPLGMPLLAGPGAISLVIVYGATVPAAMGSKLAHWSAMISVIAIVSLITLVCLRAAQQVAKRIGVTGMNVTTRVGGLITAAIAIEVLAAGLIGLFPGWKT